MTSDNKNLRQSSLDILGRPSHMLEREGRHCAPGSYVHCVGLKIISQSSPRLSRAPPRFCPGCSLCLACLSLSSCQLVLKGSADVLPPLTAPGRSRGCAVWLHRALCVPLSPELLVPRGNGFQHVYPIHSHTY